MKRIITPWAWLWVLSLSLTSVLAQQPSPRLIPYQARLTDQQGRPYTNGQFTLTFNLYPQAVGGTPFWTERHLKVGVINGMVNVFLGSIESLERTDFSTTRHLGITIDADDNPVTADPEMVPRQMIIPAFWAKQADNSTLLAGKDWSAILVSGNDPAIGHIRGDRLQEAGISTDRIAPGAVTTDRLAPGAVRTASIGDGEVTLAKLAPGLRIDTVIPPGVIQAYGGTDIPGGWLLCDGRKLSSAQYPLLYRAISTNWGRGDQGVPGATNDFNLPGLQGYFLRGVSGSMARDPDRDTRTANHPGGNTGNRVGSVQEAQLESHTHTVHGALAAGSGGVDRIISEDGLSRPSGGRFSWLTSAEGGSETRPMNAYVHYIIKY